MIARMRGSLRFVVPALAAFACSQSEPQPTVPPLAAPVPATQPAPSSFEKISLHVGMQREKAEDVIAAALGKKDSEYSPYGNNLRGGTVEYVDAAGYTLEVVYKPGASAPWVVGSNGVAEHYPPIDEAVISFRVYRK